MLGKSSPGVLRCSAPRSYSRNPFFFLEPPASPDGSRPPKSGRPSISTLQRVDFEWISGVRTQTARLCHKPGGEYKEDIFVLPYAPRRLTHHRRRLQGMELHCGKNPWRKFSVATRAVSLLTAGGPASRAAHALPTQTQNTPTPHHTHTKTPQTPIQASPGPAVLTICFFCCYAIGDRLRRRLINVDCTALHATQV